ncbi:hypothetical protein VSDG_06117 [Cytospora chrysosperma]|uniref:Uncharacterized protein n=1 Tax=Cytospora chrysosperma TaxID=252740 RepID=A0A423VUB3_CYTCH|nr:hypothetical protein VSDG_06117 [Valsa sordida]
MEKTKLVHQLDTPFSCVQWPKVSQEDQDEILDLLCKYVFAVSGLEFQLRVPCMKQQPSKGKRSKARKRKRNQGGEPQADPVVPPPPIVAGSVDVGLSKITRNFESSAAASPTTKDGGIAENRIASARPGPYAIIFVARSGPPSAFFSHFPQMVAVASKPQKFDEAPRLVGLSKSCEDKLGACLGIPRVSSLGLRVDNTAQSKALIDFVRKRVPPVEAPWLDETAGAKFQDTKINTIQTPIGNKRQKKT